MATTFKPGDNVVITVNSRPTAGKVSFIEDGYMSVKLRNGVEMDFEAPFEGKVKLKINVDIDRGEDPTLVDIYNSECMTPFIVFGRAYQEAMARKVTAIGGKASSWFLLTTEQRMNFIAVIVGCTVADLKRMHLSGELSKFTLLGLLHIGKAISETEVPFSGRTNTRVHD